MSDVNDLYLQRLRDPHGEPFRINLIGVAGSGMSGLASLLMSIGHQVSGSDKVTTVETERLETAGLKFGPQDAQSVEGSELVIYSSAIKPGNPAYDAAVRLGIPLVRRAEALAAVMEQRKGIVVCGTHGKTTTSSMAAHVLRSGGLKPSHYVGAEIPLLGSNAHWERGTDYFVAEGDESDGTLALFRPEHAIVLNIEEEHLDFYSGIEAINAVFRQLLDQTRGFYIYCAEDKGALALCKNDGRAVSYGWNPEFHYAATQIREKRGSSSYVALQGGLPLGEIELSIPGRHNVLNSLAIVALATELGITFGVIKAALGTFRGAKRRFEKKYQSAGYQIFDDYGHHPTEVEATLKTARSLEPGRLVCLFQPHRFTRTMHLRDQFGVSFDSVDLLAVTDVYPASEKPIPGISGETICDAVCKLGKVAKVESTPTFTQARFALGNQLRPNDLFITLGAGDVHEVGTAIAKDLAQLEELEKVLDEEDAVLRLYEPMNRHTTMLIGGPAQYWVEPRTIAGFARLVAYCSQKDIPVRVIGRGSNLLIRDGGIPGVVIHPAKGDFERVEVRGDLVEAGAGARFKKITSTALSAGLAGFEWMEGIPGNAGGGIRMNAGAMGADTFGQVVSVTYVDPSGEILTKQASEIQWNYRSVPEFTDNYVVSVVFRGTPGDPDAIRARIDESKEHRRTSQPVAASAGCIFKNPSVCGAGKLIDELGLKGTSVGAARVSEVHGNFIVNDGGATARNVLDLIEVIRGRARQERGVELETEVQILGVDTPY